MTYRIGPSPDCDYPGMPDLLNADVLQPGDLVEITGAPPDKAYGAASKLIYPTPGAVEPITFRGIPDADGQLPAFDGRGKDMASPRAFFECYGSVTSGTAGDGAWVIEDLEFGYATNGDMNGCAVRNVNAASVTIRGCKIWNCAAGVMSSEPSGETLIEDCDIGFCGYGDGHSHNIYCMGERFRLLNSRVHDSTVGQNVKTRARFVEMSHNEIFYSRDGEIGIIQSGDGTPEDSWVTSQPGSNAIVCDNEIVTRPDRSGGNEGNVVTFGRDMGTTGRNGTLYFHGNKVICQSAANNPITLFGTTSSLDARHNKFLGASKHILSEREPAVDITGEQNWTADEAETPAQFIIPAVYDFSMGDEYGFAAPAKRHLRSALKAPANLRDRPDTAWVIEWDPVPHALFYRIWRFCKMNGAAKDENTIWGGATEPWYQDCFQHFASTDTKQYQYIYRVQAIDLNGGESEQSAKWIKEQGVPGFAG